MTIMSRNLHPQAAEPEQESGWDIPHIPLSKIAAICFWLAGWYLTYRTVFDIVPDQVIAGLVAFILQVALSKCESSIWRRWVVDADGSWIRRSIHPSAWPCLLLDTAVNIPGTWLVLQNIHQWKITTTVWGFWSATPAPLVGGWAFAATLLCAMIPCALPEVLWYMD